MNMRPSSSASAPIRRALSGALFPVSFLVGEAVAGQLATAPLPMPDAPVAEVVAYFGGSRTAAVVLAAFQALSAVALLVFAGCVVLFLRRTLAGGGALAGLARGGGVLAAFFLLASALLALALTQVAAGGDAGLVRTLRTLNFLTGGTLHVASLGVFVGAAALAARRAGALPGWIVWLGLVQAALAVLSLASLAVFYAALFILLGRMLGFVWCAAAGVALALGRRPAPVAAAAGG
jgi:hypothetical protein